MQRRAADDLRKFVTDALVERGFLYEGAKAFATPRRLALHVAGLPARGQDVREERKGPRVGAPDGAIQGFLKGAGLASLDAATVVKDPKKGEFYVVVIERPGRPTLDVLAEILPQIIRSFPWPKSMRWGKASAQPGPLRWVRPLQSIVATFGPETETPDVVPFTVDGSRPAPPPTVTVSWRRRPSRSGASTTTSSPWSAPRSFSTWSGGKTSFCTMPAISPSRGASNSWRTRACWRRSRASWNGRWC